MVHPDRLAARISALGLSQSELARRVGIKQQTIHKLLTGASRGTTHIARLARQLHTTPAFLEGEIDDPDENAAPPPPVAPPQVILQIPLPSEAALHQAFQALLSVSRRMDEDELAHELAKRLPTLLVAASGPYLPQVAQPDAPPAPAEADASDHRESRRAQYK